MQSSLADLDPRATLARAESATRRRRAVELEDLELLAHWAMLHGERVRAASRHRPRRGGRRGVDRCHRRGQTGTHNSGPLRRRHHRVKTHTGLTAEQIGPGRYLWRTRYGRTLLVDHIGTRRLPRLELVYDAA